MHQYKLLLAFLFILCTLSSCRKDKVTTDMDRIPPDVQFNIESAINGFVTNSTGMPIPDATVSIINESVQTNEFGFFEIKGLVGEQQAVIKVEKDGYFNQFKTLIPSADRTDRTQIQLIEKNSPQSIQSSAGGLVTIFEGTTVQFQADGFITASGNSYSGEVKVFSFFIDPTSANLEQIMPGNLMAQNTENELRLLQSFGMVNVLLEGSNGEPLNISKPATLTVEVPAEIRNNAPSNIPLWHFEESTGYWIEEGSAVLENGKYVGTVDHFTFWNCDIPIEKLTLIDGQIINDLGSQIVKVQITDPTTGVTRFDWTDQDGYFDGYVPKDVSLLMEVLDVCSNTVIFSITIGPFSDDEVSLGEFNVSSSDELVVVSGTLIDCDLNPISNGQVIISNTDLLYPEQGETDADGNFSIVTTVCGATELELIALDFDNIVVTDLQTFPVAPNMPLGNVSVCGDTFTNSVVLIIDGVVKTIPDCELTITDNGTQTSYTFEFEDADTGELPVGYTWTLHDTNNDLNNPDWTTNMGYTLPTVTDSILVYSGFQAQPFLMEVLQEASNPGDILSLKFDHSLAGTIKFYGNGNAITYGYGDCTIILNGTLQ